MFCYNCGKNIETYMKFCPACGTSINKSSNISEEKTEPPFLPLYGEKIYIDDARLSQAKLINKFEEFAQKSKLEVENRLHYSSDNKRTIILLASQYPTSFENAIEYALDILQQNQVYSFDNATFKETLFSYPESAYAVKTEDLLCELETLIGDMEDTIAARKNSLRNRNKIGAFGTSIGGYVDASIKAGALNAVTGTIGRVGNAISNAIDKASTNRAIRDLSNEQNVSALGNAIYQDCKRILNCLFEILNIKLLYSNTKQNEAELIANNILNQKIGFENAKKAIVQAINTYPCSIAVMRTAYLTFGNENDELRKVIHIFANPFDIEEALKEEERKKQEAEKQKQITERLHNFFGDNATYIEKHLLPYNPFAPAINNKIGEDFSQLFSSLIQCIPQEYCEMIIPCTEATRQQSDIRLHKIVNLPKDEQPLFTIDLSTKSLYSKAILVLTNYGIYTDRVGTSKSNMYYYEIKKVYKPETPKSTFDLRTIGISNLCESIVLALIETLMLIFEFSSCNYGQNFPQKASAERERTRIAPEIPGNAPSLEKLIYTLFHTDETKFKLLNNEQRNRIIFEQLDSRTKERVSIGSASVSPEVLNIAKEKYLSALGFDDQETIYMFYHDETTKRIVEKKTFGSESFLLTNKAIYGVSPYGTYSSFRCDILSIKNIESGFRYIGFNKTFAVHTEFIAKESIDTIYTALWYFVLVTKSNSVIPLDLQKTIEENNTSKTAKQITEADLTNIKNGLTTKILQLKNKLNKNSSLFFDNNLHNEQKRVNNALSSYANSLGFKPYESLYVLYDHAILSSGKKGMLITNRGIYSTGSLMFSSKFFVDFSNIKSTKIEKAQIVFNDTLFADISMIDAAYHETFLELLNAIADLEMTNRTSCSQKTCTLCGALLPNGAKFCGACGTSTQ